MKYSAACIRVFSTVLLPASFWGLSLILGAVGWKVD